MFNELTLYKTIQSFYEAKIKSFENTAGKEENAGDQHFLHFPQRIPTTYSFRDRYQAFEGGLFCYLQMLSVL